MCNQLFLGCSLSFLSAPLLCDDLLTWYFCGLGQMFLPSIFSFLMNYKVVGGPL